MRTDNCKILKNQEIAPGIFVMEAEADIAKEVKPGQFVQVEVPGFFLRRPISVSDTTDTSLFLVYRVAGQGTREMSHLKTGEEISLFGPLGNGFPIENRPVLLIGGGIGVPPLLKTAKEYRRKNMQVSVALGFNTEKEIILKEQFESLGCDVHIATMDGSCGIKGTALDAIHEDGVKTTFVCACGPGAMLKAVSQEYKDGYISMESRMACGMGACMGCVVKDKEGNSLRVCKDGPVFPIGKVVL